MALARPAVDLILGRMEILSEDDEESVLTHHPPLCLSSVLLPRLCCSGCCCFHSWERSSRQEDIRLLAPFHTPLQLDPAASVTLSLRLLFFPLYDPQGSQAAGELMRRPLARRRRRRRRREAGAVHRAHAGPFRGGQLGGGGGSAGLGRRRQSNSARLD